MFALLVVPLDRPALIASCTKCVKLGQQQPEKLAQGKRIGGPPGDRSLRIQPFEIADQQQPKTVAWR